MVSWPARGTTPWDTPLKAYLDGSYPDKAATEAAIARVDPGTAGTARQRVVIDADGDPAWMDDQVFDLAHPYYGVTGNGVETERVQAAIDDAIAAGGGVIQFPNFAVKAGGLEVTAPGITFQGHGLASHLTSASGNTVTLTGANRFTCRDMRIQGAHGHVFEITDSLSHARFENLTIKQYADDKSILYGDDTISGRPELNYIDNLWLHCDVEHTESASVASFHLRGGAVNRNKWMDIRPTYSGNYVWLIESTNAGAYANDNTIEAITAEVCTGGIFKGLGVQGLTLRDLAIYDLYNSSERDMIYFANAPIGNIPPRQITLDNVRRNGFTLGAGLFDVNIETSISTPMLLFVNCGGSTALTVDMHQKRAVAITSTLSVTRDNGMTYIGRGSAGNRFYDPVDFDQAVTLASYTTAGRPSAATAGAGAMVYDTTLGQPIWSDGTDWTDATGTAV